MSQSRLAAWYQASRPPFFVATMIPLTLGGVVAHADGYWNTLRWVILLVASFFVHLNTNLANDYFDYTSGADAGDSIGGSRVIHEGKITLSQIRNAIILLYALAFAAGLWIVWDSKVWWLLAFMFVAFCSSLFYTAPPIRYGYLGLGEILVGVNMGPIMVVGAASAVAGHFLPRSFWLSLPVGFMVALILYYQSLPDIEADCTVGKRTIAVRLGKPTAIWGFRFLAACTLLSIGLLVAAGLLHPAALLSLLTLLIALRVDEMIRITQDWKDLHDRGGKVRAFYLVNGIILILTVVCFG